MYPRKLPLILLVMAIVLSGCELGTPFEEAKSGIPAVAEGKGRIFVYRTSNLVTLAFPRKFVLDGKFVANILAGNSYTVETSPGDHTATDGGGDFALKFKVEAGKTKYIRYTIVDDSVAKGNTIIEDVPEDQALTHLKSTQFIGSK
jgi:hypothetical protein